MKIVNIIGGLGNQMFQYAFALRLKHENPSEEVKLDISHFGGYGLHNGFELRSVFPSAMLPIATAKDLQRVTWHVPNYKLSRIVRHIFPLRKTEYVQSADACYQFDEKAILQSGNRYYEGYWQSPCFFDKCRGMVLSEFSFRPFDTDQNRYFSSRLVQDNSIAIHVRRGDYVNHPIYKDICTLDYYRKAIVEAKKVINDPEYFVFSNDVQWCKDNLNDLFGKSKVNFVSNNKGTESYRDMQLMSQAECLILANSSFSWWSAYLSSRNDQVVFAPNRWANGFDDADLFPKEWIKIF